VVDAGCTAAGSSFRVVDTLCFPRTTQHCHSVRRELEIDAGAHGRLSPVMDGNVNKVNATGDITG
jgi:hypothetical protein